MKKNIIMAFLITSLIPSGLHATDIASMWNYRADQERWDKVDSFVARAMGLEGRFAYIYVLKQLKEYPVNISSISNRLNQDIATFKKQLKDSKSYLFLYFDEYTGHDSTTQFFTADQKIIVDRILEKIELLKKVVSQFKP